MPILHGNCQKVLITVEKPVLLNKQDVTCGGAFQYEWEVTRKAFYIKGATPQLLFLL